MGVRYTIEGRILYFTTEDYYSLADIRQALDQAIAAPEFVAPMLLFGDGRLAKVAPSMGELRATADYAGSIKAYFFPDWIAVVAGPLRFGLTRMLAAFAEVYGVRFHVYREMKMEQAHEMARTLIDQFTTQSDDFS